MDLKRLISGMVGFAAATIPLHAFELVNSYTDSMEPVMNCNTV